MWSGPDLENESPRGPALQLAIGRTFVRHTPGSLRFASAPACCSVPSILAECKAQGLGLMSMNDLYQPPALMTMEDLSCIVSASEKPVLLVEGTRRLPDIEAPLLAQLGRLLAKRFPQVTFRSGNADGSDTAFAEAVASIDPARLQYVLPSLSMGKKRRHKESFAFAVEQVSQVIEDQIAEETVEATAECERLVDAHRGLIVNNRLAAMGRYLLRDTLKVVGDAEHNLAPATAGIFYVNEKDPMGGGTGHTIRVCVRRHVPVAFQHVWKKWL